MNKYKLLVIREKLKKDVYENVNEKFNIENKIIFNSLISCLEKNHTYVEFENIFNLDKKFDTLKRMYKKYQFIKMYRYEIDVLNIDRLCINIDYEKLDDYIYMLLEGNE